MKLLPRLLTGIATLGPVGFLPKVPGTWGSALAVVVWWFLLAGLQRPIYLIVLAAVTVVAVISSHIAERSLGHDAHPIVIDEVAGQWLALFYAPRTVWVAAAGFLLFRLFDVWKPFPVRISQRLPGGVGVVIDDLLAGGYVLLWLSILTNLAGV